MASSLASAGAAAAGAGVAAASGAAAGVASVAAGAAAGAAASGAAAKRREQSAEWFKTVRVTRLASCTVCAVGITSLFRVVLVFNSGME